MVDDAVKRGKDAMLRLSQFRSALTRGAKLLSRTDPEKVQLLKRGLGLVERSLKLRSSKALCVFFTFAFFLGAFTPMLMIGDRASLSTDFEKRTGVIAEGALTGAPEDFSLGALSANLTTTTTTSTITVWTEEYSILVDYSTSFVDYKIKPYFCTDFIRYRRSNPQYAGDGVTDSSGNSLDSVTMTISKWGRTGTTVWFLESCPEFSINQTFRVYRDYFELDATYKPGTKKVIATYFFGIYSSSNSVYSMVNSANNRYNRYLPGFAEDTPEGYGLGGWYPSFKMYAPACDLRASGKNIGVEWGYNETEAYLHSPLWMKDCDTGGANVMALKYSSMNSVVPNVGLGTAKTFHMFVRPYKYTDGKDRGYDVGYAQWVAPKIASAWGNHNTPIFPLAIMDLGTWTTAFRTWVENSQVKVATYSNNPNQVNWNYKSTQISNTDPGTPSTVLTEWQLYISSGTPMTTAEGRVVCSVASGPATQSNTYRWQLINNDPYMSWWTGTTGVFWDEINMWTAENKLRSDYQNRADFVYEGYLKLMKESYASGYWNYVITNPFTALLHLSIAADVSLIEGYEATSVYGTDLTKHVVSTMDFVNNIPTIYRPHLMVYQNYDTGSSADQEKVYSALFGSAKYKFDIELLSFNSYSSQLHNLQMAEDMFKAMGCTRDSGTRIPVDTLDLSKSLALTSSANMVVIMGAGKPTITETSSLDTFKITNLHATSNDFDLRIPGSGYYLVGPGAQAVAMSYSSDGYAKFSGRVDAEKTAVISRSSNLNVVQRTAGTATVSLSSAGPSADLMVSATGGVTNITLKGFVAGKTYDILVNGAVVDRKAAASDGSVSFSRTFGSGDHVTTRESSQPDSTAPFVTSCVPANAAINIAVGSQITISFNESMNQSSAQTAFSLVGGSTIPGSFSWQDSSRTMVFTPSSALSYSTAYTITVGTGAKDLAGNHLPSSYSSSFSTEQYHFTPSAPGAPTGLAGTASAQHVSLSWIAPSNNGGAAISNYKIYRGTAAGGEGTTPLATIGNLTSYEDAGLQNGVSYYYKVSAVNSAGEGNRSNEAQATTPSVPAAPTGLTGTGGYRSSTISWTTPTSNGGSNINGYNIYRGTVSGSLSLLTSVGVVLSYMDPNLANGTRYYYQVAAVNGIGEGTRSVEFSAVTYAVVPTGPEDVVAGTMGSGNISLTWSAPSSDGGSAVTGYRIYRGGSAGSETFLASVGAQSIFLDSGLSTDQTYYYQVSAVNGVGEGARSEEASVFLSAALPTSPQDLVAIGSDSKVSLSWSAPDRDGGLGVSAYKVYRGTTAGGETYLGTASALAYNDASVINGQRYFYQVNALNAVGEGSRSSEVSATPFGLPKMPQDLEVRAGNGRAVLTWSAPSDTGGVPIVGFNIYRGDVPSAVFLIATVGEVLEHEDLGLQNGATYYYTISAVTEVGEGPQSSFGWVTPGFVPSEPLGLAAEVGNAIIRLTWSAPNEDNGNAISNYTLYRAGSSGGLTVLTTLGIAFSYEDRSVVNGLTYHYRVSASNSFGEGAFSSEASAEPITVPSVPLDLEAQGGVGQITLTWSAPENDGGSDVIGYILMRGSQSDSISQIADIGLDTIYVDNGLSRGSTYYYALLAFNAAGIGDYARTSASTSDVPSAPLGVTASATIEGISVQWSAPVTDGGSPISGYRIYRGESPSNLFVLAYLSSGFSYSDPDLHPGITFYYAVAAVNSLGEGPLSQTCSATANAVAPSPPTNLTVSVSGNGLSLLWSAPANDGGAEITTYRIYRASGSAPLAQYAECIATSYSDSAVGRGVAYRYAVTAVNAQAEGQTSNEANGVLAGAPAAASGLQAIKGRNSVTLTWIVPDSDGGSAITSYVIYRGISPGNEVKLTTSSATHGYVDSSLPKVEKAYYRVSAVNEVSEGPLSNEVSVVLMKKPSAPSGLQASASDGAVRLTWEAPIDDGGEAISGYTIYLTSDSGGLEYQSTVQATEILIQDLENGVTYRYSVAAVNSMGQSDATVAVEATPLGLSDMPATLTAVPYDGLVMLRWGSPLFDGGAEITGYKVYQSQGGNEICVAELDAQTHSCVCSDLQNGLEYLFSVSAVSSAGEGARSLASSTTPFAGKSASVSGGSAGNSLIGGGIMTTIFAVALLAAIFLYLGFWNGPRNGRKGATDKKSEKEETVVKQEQKYVEVMAGPEIAVQPISEPRLPRQVERPKAAEKIDTAFEDSLRELEELESQL